MCQPVALAAAIPWHPLTISPSLLGCWPRASELVDYVEQRKADVVCISAAPPAAVAHARRLRMRLRRQYPKLNLILGLWNAPGDLTEAKARIGSDASTHIVATLADAREQMRIVVEWRSEKQLQPDGKQFIRNGLP